GFVVAEVGDRALTASGDDGGVADGDESLVDDPSAVRAGAVNGSVATNGRADVNASSIVTFVGHDLVEEGLQLDGGLGRTEIAVGGADELQPGLDLRAPVVVEGGTTDDDRVVVVNVAVTSLGSDERAVPATSVVAPSEFVLHFARDLQAVGVGRDGQARKTESVTDVQRGENAEIGSEAGGRETSGGNRTEDKALEFH